MIVIGGKGWKRIIAWALYIKTSTGYTPRMALKKESYSM